MSFLSSLQTAEKDISNALVTGFKYVPVVIKTVVEIETTFPKAGGGIKKALSLSGIQALAKLGEQIPEAHVQLISSLIDEIVTILNNAGIFTKSAASVVATPTTPLQTTGPGGFFGQLQIPTK